VHSSTPVVSIDDPDAWHHNVLSCHNERRRLRLDADSNVSMGDSLEESILESDAGVTPIPIETS